MLADRICSLHINVWCLTQIFSSIEHFFFLDNHLSSSFLLSAMKFLSPFFGSAILTIVTGYLSSQTQAAAIQPSSALIPNLSNSEGLSKSIPDQADITKDYPFEEYSFPGNKSWGITSRPDGLYWLHESRFHTAFNSSGKIVESRGTASKRHELLDIKLAISSLTTGCFTNAQFNYFAAPQQCSNIGNLIGHT